MKKIITILIATTFLFASGCAQQDTAAPYESEQDLSSLEQTEVQEDAEVSESASAETQNMSAVSEETSTASDESEEDPLSEAEKNELRSYGAVEEVLEGISEEEYLSLYAVDSFETAYVKLGAVDGLAYVYRRIEDSMYKGRYIDLVNIYNQGVRCGTFRVEELYPTQYPRATDWRSALGLEMIMENKGFRGAAVLQEHVTEGDIERFYYAGGIQAYVYGDTEWLVAEDFFDSVEEACAETEENIVVVYGKADSTEGYSFTLDSTLISEETVDALLEALTFKPGAFEQDNMDITLTYKDAAPRLKGKRMMDLSYKNRDKIAYHITIGELSYRVPEHMVAILREESYYDLHCYGGFCIGSIYVGDRKEGMEAGTVSYEEALFTEEQQQRLTEREHTSGLLHQTRKYLTETFTTADKTGVIYVERRVFK